KKLFEMQRNGVFLPYSKWSELWINGKNGRGILFLKGGSLPYKDRKGYFKIKLGLPRFILGGRKYRTKTKDLRTLIGVNLSQGKGIKESLKGSWGGIFARGNCRVSMSKEDLQSENNFTPMVGVFLWVGAPFAPLTLQ
ncbi:MAG: hypothetical protein OSB02_12820, partial [Rhodospirillaceae bacterium]|nr:hypothetical protein [Rhodospirillaceae bacterium]